MKHSQKGGAGTVVVVIVAILLIAGGWYYMAHKNDVVGMDDSNGQQSIAVGEQNPAQAGGMNNGGAMATSTATTTGVLAGSMWNWQYTQTNSTTKLSPKDSTAFLLTFGPNRLISTTDCNSVAGLVTVDGDSIMVGQLISTKMACDAQSLETSYTAQLGTAATFGITGDELRIFPKVGGTMIFKRHK